MKIIFVLFLLLVAEVRIFCILFLPSALVVFFSFLVLALRVFFLALQKGGLGFANHPCTHVVFWSI